MWKFKANETDILNCQSIFVEAMLRTADNRMDFNTGCVVSVGQCISCIGALLSQLSSQRDHSSGNLAHPSLFELSIWRRLTSEQIQEPGYWLDVAMVDTQWFK